MTLSFMMTRGCRSDYIVIYMYDTSPIDATEMARTLCLPPLGIGADGLAIVGHPDLTRFTIRCLNPDGTDSPAEGDALRCCARAIESRYGYSAATLVAGGRTYESRIVGKDIGLRLSASCDSARPRDPQLRAVYRNWPGADNVVSSLGDIRDVDLATKRPSTRTHARVSANGVSLSPIEACGAVGAPATALRERRPAIRDDNIEIDTYPGSSVFAHARTDPALGTWLCGPAMLLFEAEFPWL
jgi:hypothetical protein